MDDLTLQSLTPEFLPAAVALDQQCFGGLWSAEGYLRELSRPGGDVLVLCSDFGRGTVATSEAHARAKKKDEAQGTATLGSSSLPGQNLVALGCCWSILEEAHIVLLATHPTCRSRGLGQLLLCTLLARAQQRGLQWATLEVRASNQAAIGLYRKFGFREAGRRRRYYADTGEDALILWRSGLQSPEFATDRRCWECNIHNRLQQAGYCLRNQFLTSPPIPLTSV